MENDDPKRYEWLLSFPMDDMQDNSSDNNPSNANQADSSQPVQDTSNSAESGEGALSSSAGLGENAPGETSSGVQTSCDGGCAM